MTNYKSMQLRIESAASVAQLKAQQRSLDRLWHNGIFTVSEMQRLDQLIMARIEALTIAKHA